MTSPIQFDSSGGGFAGYDIRPGGGTASTGTQASAAGAITGGTPSLSQSAISVQTQVDDLLASFGPELAGDQQLRMIIALLILQALLGRDEDNTSHKATELAGLAANLDSFGRPSQIALFSETNIVQIQHQSTLVYSDQAIQTTTEGELGGGGASGSRLDVKA